MSDSWICSCLISLGNFSTDFKVSFRNPSVWTCIRWKQANTFCKSSYMVGFFMVQVFISELTKIPCLVFFLFWSMPSFMISCAITPFFWACLTCFVPYVSFFFLMRAMYYYWWLPEYETNIIKSKFSFFAFTVWLLYSSSGIFVSHYLSLLVNHSTSFSQINLWSFYVLIIFFITRFSQGNWDLQKAPTKRASLQKSVIQRLVSHQYH